MCINNDEAINKLTEYEYRIEAILHKIAFSCRFIPEGASDANSDTALQFESVLKAWEDGRTGPILSGKGWQTIVLQACAFPDLPAIPEEDRPVLRLNAFSGPAATWIGLLVAELARQGDQVFDLSDAIRRLLKEKNLYCSEDNDLVYVGLLSLLWSCAEQSRFREFFRECLNRYIRNDGLLMRVTMKENPSSPNFGYSGGINSDNLNWTFVEARNPSLFLRQGPANMCSSVRSSQLRTYSALFWPTLLVIMQ